MRRRVAEAPTSGPGVYFAQGELTQLVKIGYAADVRTRFISLRSQNADVLRLLAFAPCETLIDAAALEKSLHHQYADSRVRHEWFRPTPAMMAYIDLMFMCASAADIAQTLTAHLSPEPEPADGIL